MKQKNLRCDLSISKFLSYDLGTMEIVPTLFLSFLNYISKGFKQTQRFETK